MMVRQNVAISMSMQPNNKQTSLFLARLLSRLCDYAASIVFGVC
jgi:hypothetical protein